MLSLAPPGPPLPVRSGRTIDHFRHVNGVATPSRTHHHGRAWLPIRASASGAGGSQGPVKRPIMVPSSPGAEESNPTGTVDMPADVSAGTSSGQVPVASTAATPTGVTATNPAQPAPSAAANVRPTSMYVDSASGAGKPMEMSSDTATPADDAAEAVKGGVDQAADVVEGAVEQAAEGLQEGTQAAADVAEDAVEAVKGAVSRAADAVEDAASSVTKSRSYTMENRPLTAMPASCSEEDAVKKVDYYKKRLLATVAGLDRGFAATSLQGAFAESAASALIDAAGGAGQVSWLASADRPSQLRMLDGTWRLVYSSAFRSGSLGGRQPGPSARLTPLTLGQVYQVIDGHSGGLDNVVELASKINLPSLPFGPASEPARVTVALKHRFRALERNRVEITFVNTEFQAAGGFAGLLNNLPAITLPSIPEGLQASGRFSTFEVAFLDEEMRVTRGNRGELRVFVRSG